VPPFCRSTTRRARATPRREVGREHENKRTHMHTHTLFAWPGNTERPHYNALGRHNDIIYFYKVCTRRTHYGLQWLVWLIHLPAACKVTNCCFSNSSCNSTNRAASSSVCSPHLMLMLARASHHLRRRLPRVNRKHITVPRTQTPFTQSRDALPCRVTIAAAASYRWVWRVRTTGDAGWDRAKT